MNESIPLQVTPYRPVHYPGDNVTCEASGSPPVFYRWTDQDDPFNWNRGADLVFSKTNKQHQRWECQASNYPIGVGEEFTISKIFVFDVHSGEYDLCMICVLFCSPSGSLIQTDCIESQLLKIEF